MKLRHVLLALLALVIIVGLVTNTGSRETPEIATTTTAAEPKFEIGALTSCMERRGWAFLELPKLQGKDDVFVIFALQPHYFQEILMYEQKPKPEGVGFWEINRVSGAGKWVPFSDSDVQRMISREDFLRDYNRALAACNSGIGLRPLNQ